jgi:hypothetical protein
MRSFAPAGSYLVQRSLLMRLQGDDARVTDQYRLEALDISNMTPFRHVFGINLFYRDYVQLAKTLLV